MEWWYFTGNLHATDGRAFGFQLTFFRFALAPPVDTVDGASAWSDPQVYMAHFAVSDVAGGGFRYFERLSRKGPGMAGAAAPFHVWLDDWEARGEGDDGFPLRLRAAADGAALELVLERGKPPVLQGEDGLSRKSAEPGNASYYYSLTRMPARGTLVLDGERFEVGGDAWLDREWSTSALADDQVGWDWFSLQLDDGSELMYYRLRRRDGSTDPASAGVLVDAAGGTRALAHDEVELVAVGEWHSADGATRYPAGFVLRVPSDELELDVRPRVPGQELRVRYRYFEGAVQATGTRSGSPVAGLGYLEMTGYAVSPSPRAREAAALRAGTAGRFALCPRVAFC